MEFLARHYEKLILVFCLLGLLGGIFLVGQSAQLTSSTLSANLKKAQRDVQGGEMVEVKAEGDYDVEKFLTDRRRYMNVLGDSKNPTAKGSLIEPRRLIKCNNEECNMLLTLNTEECPFCKTKQPALGKETAAGDDTDSDGIPDSFEQASKFLNFRDPTDAKMDYDNDGFLNVEEYASKTALDDPEAFPPLGVLLRVLKVTRENLTVKLTDINKNRTDDKSKWDLSFKFFDAKKNKQRSATFSIGNEVAGYKILDAGFAGEGNMATPFAVIASKNNSDQQYRLEPDKDVPDQNLSVELIYLQTRDRQYVRALYQRRLKLKVGDEFPLNKNKMRSRVTENYRLLAADDGKSTAKVALLKEAGGAVEKEIEVDMFNVQEDFVEMNMMRGMEGGDMMMPDAGMQDMGRQGGRNRRGFNRQMMP